MNTNRKHHRLAKFLGTAALAIATLGITTAPATADTGDKRAPALAAQASTEQRQPLRWDGPPLPDFHEFLGDVSLTIENQTDKEMKVKRHSKLLAKLQPGESYTSHGQEGAGYWKYNHLHIESEKVGNFTVSGYNAGAAGAFTGPFVHVTRLTSLPYKANPGEGQSQKMGDHKHSNGDVTTFWVARAADGNASSSSAKNFKVEIWNGRR